MEKATVYLPDDAIRVAVNDARTHARGGLFAGSEPIADRAEQLLEGFGER